MRSNVTGIFSDHEGGGALLVISKIFTVNLITAFSKLMYEKLMLFSPDFR